MRKTQRVHTCLLFVGAMALAACTDDHPTAVLQAPAPEGSKMVMDEAVGAALMVPEEWRVHSDPVLFNTYGFVLFDPQGEKVGGHDRSPVARIALAYGMSADEIDERLRKVIADNTGPNLNPERVEVDVGEGLRGVGVTGLPGTDPYSLVYVVADGRVYRIGLWSQGTDEPGIDDRGRALLKSLRFERPARSVHSLGLVPVEQAMHAPLSAAEAELSLKANAERAVLVAENTRGMDVLAPSSAPEVSALSSAAACEFGAPASLYWQTVWDNTNKFYSGYTTTYSGSYYNMRPGDRGWSAMSGNYGSWWGQNYHTRKCSTYYLNQFYANDWPAHKNANVYSSIPGTVEYAGWDYYDSEGYYSLGNFVVVRSGGYRALMAHLTSIAVGRGATIGANTIIGYAGRTGGPWDEHVHARVAYGEYRTAGGRPYGGNTVWPTRMYCVSCRRSDSGDIYGNGDGQYDAVTSSGAKYYRRWYHGRWMRG